MKNWYLLLLTIVSTNALSQFVKYPEMLGVSEKLQPSAPIEQSNQTEDFDYTELIEKRDLFSAHYESKNGNIKSVFSNKPIHFYNEQNQLIPIRTELLKINETLYGALEQPFPTYLKTNGQFGLTLPDKDRIYLGEIVSISGHELLTPQSNMDVKGMELLELAHGIDKQLYFLENGVKYSYILTEAYQNTFNDLIISEKIDAPEYVTFQFSKNLDKTDFKTSDIILIDKRNGAVIGKISVPFCYDANKNSELGSYNIEQKEDGTYLHMRISAAWLNNSERAFPIVIDPLVSGPPSQWNGGNMPSCFMPAFNKDSILVTIPGGITLTNLIVEGSFYADPFSGAVMSQGNMYFSTSCGNSTNYTVTGANANLAGTAYLDSVNILSPLACCFPERCTDTSVYVRMHLGRNALGTGCNQTYIRYDQFNTLWPFRVTMYGRTPEAYGSEWNVPQTPICSNTCSFTATGYARYGVAPYTFTHPWSNEVVVDGSSTGCSSGATNHLFTLTNPNCPIYCDGTFTELSVPPPVITDACGTVIQNIPFKIKPIIPAANTVAVYDSIICNGSPVEINLSSCLPGGIVSYFGNGISGQGSIFQEVAANDQPIQLSYNAFTTLNDCISDTSTMNITIVPTPNAQFNIISNPTIVETPFSLIDNSSSIGSNIINWNWYINDSLVGINNDYNSVINTIGNFPACLVIEDNFGCQDSICQILEIVPASIENINIITPNGDNINDFLSFEYLSFYPDNEIFIFNRWGNELFRQKNYQNNWSGSEYDEGTYFYLLKIYETGDEYSSFFFLDKKN
jgi:gliding motility-associated-like protein